MDTLGCLLGTDVAWLTTLYFNFSQGANRSKPFFTFPAEWLICISFYKIAVHVSVQIAAATQPSQAPLPVVDGDSADEGDTNVNASIEVVTIEEEEDYTER